MKTPLDFLKSKIFAVYGTDDFAEVTAPYWKPSDGTTCAIAVSWALAKAGAPPEKVNRNPGHVPGQWADKIASYAQEKGAYEETSSLESLKKGDIYFVGPSMPGMPWHMGIVEKNEFPARITTIDGGQSDAQGRQMINRVVRPIENGMIGGPPIKVDGVFIKNLRPLQWRIDTLKLLSGVTPAPDKLSETESANGDNTLLYLLLGSGVVLYLMKRRRNA